MRAKGVEFLSTPPDDYYKSVPKRAEVPGAREEVESYTDFTQNLIDQGILNTFQTLQDTWTAKLKEELANPKMEKKKEYGISYKYPDAIGFILDAEGNPIQKPETLPQSSLPTQYAQDTIITELIEKARRKENQARADMQVKEGAIIALSPSEEIKTEMGLTISNLTTVQQELVAISQKLQEINKEERDVWVVEDALAKKRKLVNEYNLKFKELNQERDFSDDLGLFVGKGLLPSSWFDKDYKQMFDLEGNRLNPVEVATMPKNKMMEASPETKARAQELATADYRTVRARYYYNLQERIDIRNKLKTTYDFDPTDNDALFMRLKRKGYKPGEDGIFRGVEVKDLLSMHHEEVGENWITGEEGKNMLAKGWIPKDGDLVSPEIFMEGMSEDRVRISEQGDALGRMFLLNLDPGSEELNITDGLTQFAKVAVEGIGDMVLSNDASAEFKNMLPSTSREQLDFSYSLMEDAGVEMTNDQKSNFERGLAMNVTEGLGAFVPMAISFALINKIGAVV